VIDPENLDVTLRQLVDRLPRKGRAARDYAWLVTQAHLLYGRLLDTEDPQAERILGEGRPYVIWRRLKGISRGAGDV